MTLPDDRNAAGRQIIALTDSVGFDATGAGWAFTRDTGTWQFYLFTPMADTKGPLWLWERLAKAFARLKLPDGITPLDIVVASPNEALYRELMLKSGDTGRLGLSIVAYQDVSRSAPGFDDLWMLRSRPEAALLRQIASRDAAARRFDSKVRRLLAA